MSVGLVYDPIYLEHDTGMHVENAGRLREVISHLENAQVKARLVPISPRPASVEELSWVHDKEYISLIESSAQRGGGWLDADTVMSPASYKAALFAAGGLIRGVDAVIQGDVESAFALVRPPGHHATSREAMGFCLFNNVAIAAKHALANLHLDRILIADFDVHHGNGTQDTFYADPHVLYFSTHQSPLYPGTGMIRETGDGEAKGTNVNVPLPPGCGDKEYLRIFQEILVPIARRFRPQLILVSAGYDAHWADNLASMQLTVTGFAQMTKILQRLARELCQGRLVFTLEGGYHLQALAASIRATLDVLLDNSEIVDPLGEPRARRASADIAELIQRVKSTHGLE